MTTSAGRTSSNVVRLADDIDSTVPHMTAFDSTPDKAQPDKWLSTYQRYVFVVDALVLFGALAFANVARFGMASSDAIPPGSRVSYSVLGMGLAAGWWIALQVFGATDRRSLGDGPAEYRRVAHASVMAFGILAIATLLFKQDLSRGYLGFAFPIGTVGLLVGRKSLRFWLARQRRAGRMTTRVLIIGGARSAESIARWFVRYPAAGFRVTGVWVPDQSASNQSWLKVPDQFVPVMGSARRLKDALNVSEASMVIVTDTEHLGHHGLRELTWDLHSYGIDLMVSPNVVDVATPRVRLRPVGNMPFLHLQEPQFEGASRIAKTVFDKVFSVAALLIFSPLLIGAALAVKFSSSGPVFYRSERIGVGGHPFQMLKFRSMVAGAEAMKTDLTSEMDSVLFKMKDDPRVTRVGRFLRRYSIDELPQLVNVLRGEMSIVGPRPPLRDEVAQYDQTVGRRLLVKQGITGLWQVSGRSDLSWEDTVRLDMDYVENWSLMRDIQIIWRTVRAVTASSGAY